MKGSDHMASMNRRDFIGLAAGAALAGCNATAVASRNKSAGRILYGACRSSVEDVAAMRELGYDFWEWGAGPAFDPAKDDAWWKRQKEKIAQRPLPLRSCNGFIPGKFRLTGPKASHGPALDYAEKVLRRADEIGVQTIVLGSGGARNVPKDFVKADPKAVEKGMGQFVDFCKALAKRVADLKTVQVVIEPLRPKESNLVNFVWQGKEIVDEVASPRLRLLADIFHMIEGGETADSIVKAGGALLKHCHIATKGPRLYPGANDTEVFLPYFAALKRIGYIGGVSCECGWGKKGELKKNLATALETMKGLEERA